MNKITYTIVKGVLKKTRTVLRRYLKSFPNQDAYTEAYCMTADTIKHISRFLEEMPSILHEVKSFKKSGLGDGFTLDRAREYCGDGYDRLVEEPQEEEIKTRASLAEFTGRKLINVGDTVIPQTPAGLELADVSTSGEYEQKLKTTCVLKGKGTVISVVDCIIDYDDWEKQEGKSYGIKLGKVEYRSCLVRCANGEGWAGEGALVKQDGDSK